MKKLVSFAAFCALGLGMLNAQLTQVVNEVFYDPNVGPPVAGYPAGYVTYRVYAELNDPADFVSSIFAISGCHDLMVTGDNAIFNDNIGGATSGDGINAGFCGFAPTICYESWFTIGRENTAAPGNAVGVIASCPNAGVFAASLGNVNPAPNLNVCDGAIYAIIGDVNGYPTGPNNRVLLGQFTVPAGTLTYNLNLQIFNDGFGAQEIRYVWDGTNVGCGSPTEVNGECLGLIFPEPALCLLEPNDICTNAIDVSCGDVVLGSTVNATNDGAPFCVVSQITNGVWYTLTNAAAGDLVTLNLCNPGTNYDTKISVFEGGCGALTCVTGDDDEPGCNFASLVSFTADGGEYLILVHGFGLGDEGEFEMTITCQSQGCTDAGACNYDAGADVDDGSCDYSCIGCNNFLACNYGGPSITISDGSCCFTNCVTLTLFDSFDDGWNGAVYTIYDDTNTPLYTGTLSGNSGEVVSLCFADGCYTIDVTAGDWPAEISWDLDGIDGGAYTGGAPELYGFALGGAVCGVPGCTDPAACNFDFFAIVDDGSCTYPTVTITLEDTFGDGWNGNNYFIYDDSNAEVATGTLVNGFGPQVDGLCLGTGCYTLTIDGGIFDDEVEWTLDGVDGGPISGFAPNGAPIIDFPFSVGGAVCVVLGCTDVNACNYDINATQDDGSCQFPPAEDDCAGALVSTFGVSQVIDNSCATADGPDQSCAFLGAATENDIWVSFVAPASGNVRIQASGDGSLTLTDTVIEVYDACGGNSVGCDDDAGVGLFSLVNIAACDLVAGQTYYVQITGWQGDSGTANLLISITDILGCTDPLAINYDSCANVDNGTCSYGLATLAINPTFFPGCVGIAGATTLPGAGSGLPSNGPFGGNPDDEVFYELIAPCNGALKVVVDGNPGFDAVVELMDASFNALDAVDATLNGDTEIAYSDGIIAGDTYYVRIYDWFTGATGSFTVCLTAYCASSADDPYPTLTYQACDVYKCDFIPGAAGYNWNLTPQGGGATLTYSSPNNNTFLTLSNLSGPVVYGVTYDVVIDVRFTDPDLGPIVVAGVITDVLVMDAAPVTELRSDFVNGNYALNANIRCAQSCGADNYIWRITPSGGSALPDVTVPGNSTIVNLCSFTGILPGTTYSVEVAVVYGGIQYAFGPANPINTTAQPVVTLRLADNCANAGPLALGYTIFTSAFVPCAKDWTWEFTRTDVPELPIYWRKGNGVRTLKLSDVKGIITNIPLLVAGGTYNVRVKPEYGNFLGQGNDVPGLQPQYDFATNYGGVQQICIVGAGVIGAGENASVTEGTTPVRDTGVSIAAALYPNPTNGSFVNLNINNINEATDRVLVDIYDAFGKLVRSEQFATNGSSLNTVINFNGEIANGVYMVNIIVGDKVQTERLVIQK